MIVHSTDLSELLHRIINSTSVLRSLAAEWTEGQARRPGEVQASEQMVESPTTALSSMLIRTTANIRRLPHHALPWGSISDNRIKERDRNNPLNFIFKVDYCYKLPIVLFWNSLISNFVKKQSVCFPKY